MSSRILITSSRQAGFVLPLARIAAGLVARGDDVFFLAGEQFRDRIEAAGATYLPVPWDDESGEPSPVRPRGGTGIGRFDRLLRQVYLQPVEREFREVQALVQRLDIDAVLTEPTFVGAQILGMLPRAARPAVVTIGLTALPLPSRDTAPFGLGLQPLEAPANRVRNGLLNFAAERVVSARLRRDFAAEFERFTGVRPRSRSLIGLVACTDVWAQCSVPQFEYPRSDLPSFVRFVGPLPAPSFGVLPDWWDYSERRPIVHVTQGTYANDDPTEVIVPLIEALRDDDVLVVATTGGKPVDSIARALGGPLPENARVAEFLPYNHLLPPSRVVVTNGGFGVVHAALRWGVPLVVSGTTEDRTETNARVAWSGTGIDLRQRHADPVRLRAAVRRVMDDPSFKHAASRIGAAISSTDAIASIGEIVDELVVGARRS